MTANPYEPPKEESKPGRWEAFLRRDVEKQERNARGTARWNGRLLLFIGMPMLALSPLYAKDGKAWQLAITFPLACFFSWFLLRWIHWGKQRPRTADDVAATVMRRNERIKAWWNAKRSPPSQ